MKSPGSCRCPGGTFDPTSGTLRALGSGNFPAGVVVVAEGSEEQGLLAYAAAQTGLVLAAAPAVSRLLTSPRWWRFVTRLNPGVMLVYLWHMVPVLVIAMAFYPTGIMPRPRVGSAEWWELRPAWIALLAVILVPLIAGLLWVHRARLAPVAELATAHR